MTVPRSRRGERSAKWQRLAPRGALCTLLALWIAAMLPDLALAGPGGEVAELLFKTTLGRIVFGVVAVLLLPLILYVFVRQELAILRSKADLRRLAKQFPQFEWKTLEHWIRTSAPALYRAWARSDLSRVRQLFVPEYAASQQEILDRWQEEGKRNVTRLETLGRVSPLHVSVETEESPSVIRVLISMDLVDYLEAVDSHKVLKGTKRPHKGHEVLWTLVHEHGAWRIHSIEGGGESLAYARLGNHLDTSYLERAAAPSRRRGARSQTATVDAPSHEPAQEEEGEEVQVEEHDQRS